jgi:hypothetical protein
MRTGESNQIEGSSIGLFGHRDKPRDGISDFALGKNKFFFSFRLDAKGRPHTGGQHADGRSSRAFWRDAALKQR